MHFVQFLIDLGDAIARFTGLIDGQSGNDLKVLYYCPLARQYQLIELTTDQLVGSWTEPVEMLPLYPEITEK